MEFLYTNRFSLYEFPRKLLRTTLKYLTIKACEFILVDIFDLISLFVDNRSHVLFLILLIIILIAVRNIGLLAFEIINPE